MKDEAPEHRIVLKYCTVEIYPWGCRTVFHSTGEAVNAIPHEEHHYYVIAHRLGYGDNIMRYCIEHEVCHSLITQFFRDAESDVLWCVAKGTKLHPYDMAAEEAMAQLLQRFLRAGERPIISGVDWDALAKFATEALEDL